MCTLIVAVGMWPEVPLLVAANRDEQLDRRAAAPSVVDVSGRRVLMPRDLEAGGTWLGLNDAGVFVALTNRYGPNEPTVPSEPRSRGLLVLDALTRARSAAETEQWVATLRPADYRGFHLVVADATSAHLLWSDSATFHRSTMEGGIHIVTERSFGAAPTQRIDWLRTQVAALEGPSKPTFAQWQSLLQSKANPPLEGVCVHSSGMNYGTRSSTIVELMSGSALPRIWHADGPPDATPYVELTELTAKLRGSWAG